MFERLEGVVIREVWDVVRTLYVMDVTINLQKSKIKPHA